MFEIVTGAINLLGWTAAMVFTVTLHLSQTYHPHLNLNDVDTVTAFSAYKGGPWYSTCSGEGVMVPYARDWEETVQRGQEEIVLPPEPDKTVGQSYIVTKMKCKDKPEERVLLVDQDSRLHTRLPEDHTLTMQAYFGLKADQRPKWFAQVIKRLERAAATNPSAKQALDDIAAYEQQVKAEAA
ncbi:TPA: hypothetical protein QDA95_002380, partial [Burkholderia vietnamiensis]|nr:hypothetical protein [Burkholderia vietnamiensis]HDR8977319.1 hypothetical protein [Burkholderia vietnamiensis]